MQKPYNDLKRIDIPHLRSMINAFSADYGRFLSIEEYTENKKTINLLQVEIDSRQKRLQFLTSISVKREASEKS